jgi:hypothetical protein
MPGPAGRQVGISLKGSMSSLLPTWPSLFTLFHFQIENAFIFNLEME